VAAKRKAGKKSSTPTEPVSAEEKIARLLGILAVKDVTEPPQQVAMLQSAGFDVSEVASLLGITENNVNVINYRKRKKKAGRRSAKKR
jgi:hypothetical protein